MISAWLLIKRWVDGVFLTIIDIASIFQSVHLPPDKWVIVGIFAGCNEWPPPINTHTKILQVLLTLWWEILKPVFSIFEQWNLFLCKPKLLHNLILFQRYFYLCLCWCFIFLTSLFATFVIFLWFFCLFLFFFLWWLDRFNVTRFYLPLQSVGSCLNWHTCAMETEWEKSFLSSLFLISDLKFSLTHTKSVSQMELSIHIWVWEGSEIFWIILLFHWHVVVVLRSIWILIQLWVSWPNLLLLCFNFSKSLVPDSCLLWFLLFHLFVYLRISFYYWLIIN